VVTEDGDILRTEHAADTIGHGGETGHDCGRAAIFDPNQRAGRTAHEWTDRLVRR